MSAVIDYFWKNKGFVYDPKMGRPFSSYQIIMLIVMSLLFVAIWFLGKQVKRKELFVLTLSLTLLILETLRVINFKYVHHKTWMGSFSFHMCSMGVYFAIILGFIRKKWMYDVLALQALIGAPLALLIPQGILPWFNMYSFMPFQSFLTHTILFLIPFYALKNQLWVVKVKNYYIAFLSIIFSILIGYLTSEINVRYHTGGFDNFFWTRYVDPAFKQIVDWPYPYHFMIITIAILLAGFGIYYGLDKIGIKKQKC